MRLSVVVVNYRHAHRVSRSLYALRAFVHQPLEILVVDNSGGRDDLTVLPAGVRIIRNERNVGYAAAVNQGVSRATNEIVLLLNPDVDGWNGSFDAVIDTFADTSVAAVSPRLVDEAGRVEFSCRRAPRPFDFFAESLALSRRFPHWRAVQRLRMLDWDHATERNVDAVTGACLFLRRSAFHDVGRFDERFFVYGEEVDWLVRASALGYRTRFLPSVTVTHVGGGSTPASAAILDRLLIESHYRYTRKHFGRSRELALRAAFLVLDLLRLIRHPMLCGEFVARGRIHLGLRYERPA